MARPVPHGHPVELTPSTVRGFPCCSTTPFTNMPSPLPRWDCPVPYIAHLPGQLRPSPKFRRVGSHITLFEACSVFTRVTACLLAKSPLRDPLHRRLQRSCYLHRCSGCYRLERSFAGRDSVPLWLCAFPRRTELSGLILGLASLEGFQGPLDVLSCKWAPVSGPSLHDFTLMVQDASDVHSQPIVPPPALSLVAE